MMKRNNLKALVIENDSYMREALANYFKRFVGMVHEAESFDMAKQKLRSFKYDIVSIDLNLADHEESELDGLKILPIAKKQGALCFILSSYKDKETIGKASSIDPKIIYIKKGNLYGSLGIKEDIFNEYIGKLIELQFHNPLEKILNHKFVTNSSIVMERLQEAFRIALVSKQNTMFLGETGVGKTFFAELLDEAIFEINRIICKDTKRNFQHINLKSIHKDQIEATLFGSKRGSYTGSIQDRKGLFELAHKGTLFIDEVGVIPIEFQEKLLTALDLDEEGYCHFRRVGCEIDQKSKFRLMTGTSDDLEKMYQEGKLREDFYYRIASSSPLEIPTLRDRKEDIIPLIDFFLENCPRAISITDEAMEVLIHYHWHGNIRQLEGLIKDMTKGSRTEIKKFDLPSHIINNENPLLGRERERLYSRSVKKYIQKNGLNQLICVLEQEAFKAIMAETNQISTTADILGIGRKKAYAIQNRINGNKNKEDKLCVGE